MKVALIVPGGVDRGGRERVIPVLLDLIARLARHHRVLVVALDQEQDACCYPLLGATVYNLGRPRGPWGFSGFRWMRRFRALIKVLRSEGGVDVIHAPWILGPGTLALAAGKLLGVPVFVSVFGGELVWLPEIGYGGQGRLRGRIEASVVLRSAQAVTGNSHHALAPCVRRRPDAIWLPLGVDTKRFDGPMERSPGPPWRLLHVASLNRVKDQTTLLEALRLVHQREKDVYLDCVGADTLDGAVQRKASELGLEREVTFHGFLPLDMVVPFYRRAHLLVQSSLHEAGGAAVMEAAAAGLPIVGTAVGLLADMAPTAAVAVPVQSAEALAAALVDLLKDPSRRAGLGKAAQQFAHSHDADWTAAQFEGLYSRLVNLEADPRVRGADTAIAPLLKRTLVLTAHPDDETLGCGALLQRIAEPLVVLCTDGGSEALWKDHGFASREEYSAVRRAELEAALAIANIRDWEALSIAEQRLYLALAEAIARLEQIVERRRPDAILTHAYEAGHPDHDACSFLAWRLGQRFSLPVWEMPLYSPRMVQRFLRAGGGEVIIMPTPEELRKKALMRDAHKTQMPGIAHFDLARERYRPQPGHDYTRPAPGARSRFAASYPSLQVREVVTAFARNMREAGILPGRVSRKRVLAGRATILP